MPNKPMNMKPGLFVRTVGKETCDQQKPAAAVVEWETVAVTAWVADAATAWNSINTLPGRVQLRLEPV